MTDYDHPDFTVLADWVDGRLEASAAARVATAVGEDPAAAATVLWLRSFRAVADAMPLELPPPFLHERMRRQLRDGFETWRAERDAGSDAGSVRLHAELVFDSRRDLAVAGMRGIGDQDMIHLAYSVTGDVGADEAISGVRGEAVIDVVLDAEVVAADAVRLTGQVLSSQAAPTPFTTAAAHRESDPASSPLAEASIDTLGRFDLGVLADDVTVVTLSAPSAVLFAPVDVRSGR